MAIDKNLSYLRKEPSPFEKVRFGLIFPTLKRGVNTIFDFSQNNIGLALFTLEVSLIY